MIGNEQIKLTATWINGLSIATFAAAVSLRLFPSCIKARQEVLARRSSSSASFASPWRGH
ncbi:hypothetical protein CLD20_16590 [Afifella sp. IM 167]|nr:hypothetical protein [Afifella sp. IM 167]